VEHNRVILDHEPGRRHLLETRRAPVNIENPPASSAVEVVVVRLGNMRKFVARRLAGNRHRHDEPLVFEPPQRPVDRAQPQRCQAFRGHGMNLGRAQRPPGASESSLDRFSLLRHPCHHWSRLVCMLRTD
jgi:hypothetical protein